MTERDEQIHHRVALLVIDVQQGLFDGAIPVHRTEAFLDTVNGLISRARQAGAPVVYVQHANQGRLRRGSDGWQLHRDLLPPGDDLRIDKRHGSAFQETDLDRLLTERQVGTVVVTGLVTHGCVQAACLEAHRLGYRVMLPSDGHSNFNRKAADLINEWNTNLAEQGILVMPADDVSLAGDPS